MTELEELRKVLNDPIFTTEAKEKFNKDLDIVEKELQRYKNLYNIVSTQTSEAIEIIQTLHESFYTQEVADWLEYNRHPKTNNPQHISNHEYKHNRRGNFKQISRNF
jgi:Na+/phosphate symporter